MKNENVVKSKKLPTGGQDRLISQDLNTDRWVKKRWAKTSIGKALLK